MSSLAGSRLIVAALALLAAAPAVRAQTTFPVKPLRIFVGFAPGGFTDLASRA